MIKHKKCQKRGHKICLKNISDRMNVPNALYRYRHRQINKTTATATLICEMMQNLQYKYSTGTVKDIVPSSQL
jgi:hypothetical protein